MVEHNGGLAKGTRRAEEKESEEDEEMDGREWDFLQANPILPPDKHRFR